MISVKTLIGLLGLTSFYLMGLAPAALALDLEEAEQATEKLLQRIANNDLDDLANYLGNDDLFGKHPAGAWQQPAETIKSVFKVVDIGKSKLKVEKLGQKRLGSSLIANRYAVNFPGQPMLFQVMLYKFESEWEFLNVDLQFGKDSVPILQSWFDSADQTPESKN